MEQPELLPMWLPNGTQTKQISTYDTTGGNDDGFHLNLRRYVDSNGDWVIFDEYGAGALYRMQMNVWNGGRIAPSTRIKFYFDNETAPRLNKTMAEFFGKDQRYSAPLNSPLTFFDDHNSTGLYGKDRFAINYYPFPFKQHLKITMSPQDNGAIKWYQFTYLKFSNDNLVTSWQGMTQDSSLVRSQWNNLGADPKSQVGNVEVNKVSSIPAGTSATIFDLSGQGSISSINLELVPGMPQLFKEARIQMYWDGSSVPAVDMSLGSFFGGGGDTIGAEEVYFKTFKNLFYGFDGSSPNNESFYSYWPMPFWTRAKIVIVNNTNLNISSLTSNIKYKPASVLNYSKDGAGYFYAKRTIDISSPNQPYSMAFNEQGRGKVVGLMFYSTGFSADGDEFTYIDDSSTPQIHGDGTEDDHNQGWLGDAYQKALWGGLVDGYQGAYRTYYNDSYIFNKNIKITYEHSNWGGLKSGQKTDAVVYYYKDADGKSNLTLTDKLDVGNIQSENSHGYSIDKQTWFGSTNSNYDGYEQKLDYIHIIDNGRSNNGYSQFTVKIDPNNNGVKLRKRLNRYNNQIQKADVYVNDAKVTENPWYIMDLNSDASHGFIDSDFEIPSSYTVGKSSLKIKIVYLDSTDKDKGINEYYYWIYSYGKNMSGRGISDALSDHNKNNLASVGIFATNVSNNIKIVLYKFVKLPKFLWRAINK
ncbi:MAG: hypothetical protein A3F53_00105 [Candidatus Zambryskibacteria bacterium RIFCSPHIGHO2_12_FULL_48_10]|nr:MAG: hypothetical protein A3F53_00105 [Candidatus Zambryskibacteria bacterium RIFCSPHIGHO2_12_FULL_48_10]